MQVNSYKQKARGFLKELIARWSIHIRYWNIKNRNPILIFQMGKVGSSTVVKTIKTLKPDIPILHFHTLNNQNLANAIKSRRGSTTPFLPEHLVVSQYLSRKMRKGLFHCKIITLTREPVSRAISHVFEDWRRKAPNAKTWHGLDPQVMEQAVLDLVSQNNGISDPTIWFDNELKSRFNVDVFSVPFDHEKGFVIFKSKLISVLLLRMEDINWALGDALVEFLDLGEEELALINANVGNAKWYAEALGEVKANMHVPSNILDDMLHTPYVKHFYSAEVEKIRGRWSEPS